MYPFDHIYKLCCGNDDDYILASQPWVRKHRGQFLCRSCDKLLRSQVFPQQIDISLRQLPRNVLCGGVFGGGVAVIRRDVLNFLSQYEMEHVVTGACAFEDEAAIPEYLSIYFRDHIKEYGGFDATYFVCDKCGQIGTIGENIYVLRSSIPDGKVFQNAISELFVSNEIVQPMTAHFSNKIYFQELPVRDMIASNDPMSLLHDSPELVIRTPSKYSRGYSLRHAESHSK